MIIEQPSGGLRDLRNWTMTAHPSLIGCARKCLAMWRPTGHFLLKLQSALHAYIWATSSLSISVNSGPIA